MSKINMIPSEVDCIILGTGLTNSIIAAACSRIGKSVLHVDKNSYYGDEWASFTFQQLIDWIKVKSPDDKSLQNIPDNLLTKSRMFCIDLSPKLLYSNGEMVELLVKSNVSRYHEFKNNIRILSMVDDKIHVMPCRRNDVFTSPILSDLVDKRKLMKFIELCVKYDPNVEASELNEITEHAEEPISKFLEDKGLKHTFREFIINSIAMVDPQTPTKVACDRIKNFMTATERFGRSPFIFPVYGCGEFPQSFCRLSAVFGGVYCLNTQINNVRISTKPKDSQMMIDTSPAGPPFNSTHNFAVQLAKEKHEVKSNCLVMDHTNAMDLNLSAKPRDDSKLSRGILITNRSIVSNPEGNISFMRIPPGEKGSNLVHFLEFNSSAMVCPPDTNIIYLWTKASSTNPRLDLEPTVESIFGAASDAIVWQFYYQQLSGPQNEIIKPGEVEGLHITSPPSNDIDYSDSIKEAEEAFRSICPDQEFLPRAPDPDEIIS